MTRDGIPVARKVFPGNTPDVKTFRAAIAGVKERSYVRRAILVDDQGMVSKSVLQALSESGLEYIVGARMRKLRTMHEVLSRAACHRNVKDNLKVKELVHEGTQYILCYNPDEAEHDPQAREAMVACLEEKLKADGLKSLVGNCGYRRSLKITGAKATSDQKALKEEAWYHGKYVLETNCDLAADEVALAYKGFLQVERAFREL